MQIILPWMTLWLHSHNQKKLQKFYMRKISQADKTSWIKLAIIMVLYLFFLIWIKSWWGLIVVPFIFDVYITKIIKWTWWRELQEGVLKSIMSWIDAIVFAMVAVYFVNIYFFQNYTIPSSSLEKSLLVGDYLYVSKVAYGPRRPITPLTMPLTQHTMPLTQHNMPQWLGGGKSYIEKPQCSYRRVPGFGKIKQNDIVVFNYPMEDFRPVDRKENYVKRCVALPGQTLEIRDRIVYTDGVANKEPDNVQYFYEVQTTRPIPEKLRRQLGISYEDLANRNASGTLYALPLTNASVEALRKRDDFVVSVTPYEMPTEGVFPESKKTGWSIDNFGPLWIPAKGETLKLTLDNLPFYERCISVYEGHTVAVADSVITIDGTPADSYTFALDYYWMQGDNRHNSLDSRYWGFVPENHIVGKPRFIWLSLDKDRRFGDGKIRWKRMFTPVSKYI